MEVRANFFLFWSEDRPVILGTQIAFAFFLPRCLHSSVQIGQCKRFGNVVDGDHRLVVRYAYRRIGFGSGGLKSGLGLGLQYDFEC
jgi:hypothetical protein